MSSTLPHSVTPYGNEAGSKKQQVAHMFDAIAPTYDRLNRILSLRIDVLWRKRAIAMLRPEKPQVVVDLATGTGDFALLARTLRPRQIIGLDISEGMLAKGRVKVRRKGLEQLIELRTGDAEHLPLANGSVDAITVGFGVRNFENLEQGLSEMLRVLRPGGVAIVLEPGFPQNRVLGTLYRWYFGRVLPQIGRLLSRDRAAYAYLCESVSAFPNGPDFVAICKRVGFTFATWHPLTFGICSLYRLQKSA
ncbi:MAG: bifunctional demethylmenaquinone methyltransferase/2-methoxy-6-polyprenyl-1,4-benzoquinol methylase UbiE [Bacteroidia bacterium]|nr:bifunctional demethylmenaquinone methyltransferase/2-methoxy-6-polyprenyl-1,4-benzoquinol methylase UbiE [Bacteroidia bacterium]